MGRKMYMNNPFEEPNEITNSRQEREQKRREQRELERRERATRISYIQDADDAIATGNSFDDNKPQESWGSFSKNSSTSDKVAGGVQAAGAAYGLIDYASQDRNIGLIDSPNLSEGSLFDQSAYKQNLANAEAIPGDSHEEALGKTAQGAGAGFSAGGPWGALIGAVAGNISGVVGAHKARNAKKKAQRDAKKQFNSYVTSYNARNESRDFEENNMDRIRAMQNNYGIPQSFRSLI